MSTLALRGPAGRAARGRAAPLAGTPALAMLALRRDRVFLAIWLYALVGSMAATTYSFRGLYATAAQRASLGPASGTTPRSWR